MASVFVLLEAFKRKEAAALGFFSCATASGKIFSYENTGKLPFAASVFKMVIQLLFP